MCGSVDQGDLMDLATQIARGNLAGAKTALDVLFRADTAAREWIARARALVRIPDVDGMAARLAKADGLDWGEACATEAEDGDGVCESGTCIAAHYEDHDPDVARGVYRRYARVALGLEVSGG